MVGKFFRPCIRYQQQRLRRSSSIYRQGHIAGEHLRLPFPVNNQRPISFEMRCVPLVGRFCRMKMSNFATINVLDVIRRIPGVGRVSNIGSRYYAMQIWAQPDKLANVLRPAV